MSKWGSDRPRVHRSSPFPLREPFEIGGHSFTAAEIVGRLAPKVRAERRERIAEVIAARTASIAVVLEDLYDRGNISAVLRSAEALGYLAVHIIRKGKRFREADRVTRGAEKWLAIDESTSAPETLTALRDQGYRILATHFDDAAPIDRIDFSVPAAIIFGNERDGVSDEALALADGRIVVPMVGFTQSFNISVAAALTLYHIARDRAQRGLTGDLTDDQRRILTAEYYLRTVHKSRELLLHERRREDA